MEDEESKSEDLLRCSEKSSSDPAARAVSHRLAAARAAAATAAALTGRSVPALAGLRQRGWEWDSGELEAAAGVEGQWRRRLWGLGRGLGFGKALRRACCARRAWNCGSLLRIAISASTKTRIGCLRRRLPDLGQ